MLFSNVGVYYPKKRLDKCVYDWNGLVNTQNMIKTSSFGVAYT